jgi:hypothetical protein
MKKEGFNGGVHTLNTASFIPKRSSMAASSKRSAAL